MNGNAAERVVAWFLALSYGIGAPLGVVLEFRDALFSERFGLPAWFIYLTAAIQFACAPLLFSRRYGRWAAAALSVITVGAATSHFRIGSPLTSIPALSFTAVQVWLASRLRSDDAGSPSDGESAG